MGVDEPDPWPELSPQEFARWWDQTGFRELCQILLWRWDPIDVSGDFPATWDEYDSYAPQVVDMAKRNASVDEIAAHLGSVERQEIEASTTDEVRLELGRLVLAWYPNSIGLWREGMTGF